MIYYVKTGDLSASIRATTHRDAAVMAIKGSDVGLGEIVMVNEGTLSREINEDSVFFLTEDITKDCSMRLVG